MYVAVVRDPFCQKRDWETPENKMTLKTEFAVDMTCQSCGKLLTLGKLTYSGRRDESHRFVGRS